MLADRTHVKETLLEEKAQKNQKNKGLSLPIRVLIGAGLGIVSGLLLGEYNLLLKPIGSIYIQLLQAVVYPYLICTILSGLGKLSWQSDAKFLKQSSIIYLLTVIFIFLTLYIMAQGLHSLSDGGTSSSAGLSIDLLNFILPSNVFDALAKNYVPAVVIFCVLFGAVLQSVQHKLQLIDILDVISDTCLLFWNWLVKFAPIAVFAIVAETAGSIHLSQLQELSNFLVIYFLGTLLLTFWVLPIALASVTNISYRTIMKELRPALIIATATSLSVVALPHIKEVIIRLLKQAGIKDDRQTVINTSISLSYPFGQLGNFFVILFILFASLYFNCPIPEDAKKLLPFIEYLSSLGSPSTIVDSIAFLNKWLNLPNETLTLYYGIYPLVRYAQVLVSVMGIGFLTIVICFFFFGMAKINFKKLLMNILLFWIILIISVITIRSLTLDPNIKIYNRLNSTELDQSLTENVKAVIYTHAPTAINYPPIDALFRIQKTGILRVGYNQDMKPFVFFNSQGKLVGYDVSFMYALAKSLKVQLEFIPFEWQTLVNDIVNNRFDIAIGAIYVTPTRLQQVSFTNPYFQSPLSFIVPEHLKDYFNDVDRISAIKGLRIGLFNDPVLIPIARANFPNASIVILPNFQDKTIKDAFANKSIDVVMWSRAQTNIWVLGHPGFLSIVPKNIAAPFLMGYMVNKNSQQFVHFLDYWMQLQKLQETPKVLYNRWIMVGINSNQKPRWNIIDAFIAKSRH